MAKYEPVSLPEDFKGRQDVLLDRNGEEVLVGCGGESLFVGKLRYTRAMYEKVIVSEDGNREDLFVADITRLFVKT